jgi:hypothetical protein
LDAIRKGTVTLAELETTGKLDIQKREEIEKLAEKQRILNNVDHLTANKLFDAIRKGTVTLAELETTGKLDSKKREEIKKLAEKQRVLNNVDHLTANELFDAIRKGTVTLAELETTGKLDIAKRTAIENMQKTREEILEKIRGNQNSYTRGMISGYLNQNLISRNDLENVGIPANVIDRLDDILLPLILGNMPNGIPKGYTEVYFWGIPGSGKTCVLSAILSTAFLSNMLEIREGPGYDYANRLMHIFSKPIVVLPPPSPVETTQYLPFVLRKNNDRPRSVSLIELSGEIFQCFYYKMGNKSLPATHQNTFDTLTRLLKSTNRKIHFFLIDYEMGNHSDADGHMQADYLQAAATYFDSEDVFDRYTDAIYLVITKSDLMPGKKDERLKQVRKYLQENHFGSFVNSLRAKCDQYGINAGIILGTLFSLGKIYFNQICEFDNETSKDIIDILVRRIPPQDSSILDYFNR